MSDGAPIPDSKDPLRFLVPSDTPNGDPYVVDLGTWGGFGECSCPHFRFRSLGLVRGGDTSEGLRCKHIRRARESFADSMIARILAVVPREDSEDQR